MKRGDFQQKNSSLDCARDDSTAGNPVHIVILSAGEELACEFFPGVERPAVACVNRGLTATRDAIPPRTGSRQRAIPDRSTAPCRKNPLPWRSGTFLPDNTCGCSQSRSSLLRQERNRQPRPGNRDVLPSPRPQMHLHAARLGIEAGDMLKLFAGRSPRRVPD